MKSATYSRLESNKVEWGWWEEYTILSYPFSLSNTWVSDWQIPEGSNYTTRKN